MSDTTAAVLAFALVLVATMAIQHRVALQPNRGAAVVFLAGTVVWGVAVVALWVAWASSSDVGFCDEAQCEAVVESIEHNAVPSDEVILSQDWID